MALADNLVAYWAFDEASGNAIDAHASFDLTETSGTIDSTTGKVGNCRDLEQADSEYFAHADDAAFSRGDTDFTFAFWINIESFTDTNARIFSKDGANAFVDREYGLYPDTFNSNKLTWHVSGDGTGEGTKAVWGTAPSTATWYFVVVWHDSVNNQIGISVNAAAAVTSSHSSGVFNGTAEFRIGNRGDNTLHYDGLIDEFGLWGRVLTSDERTELYNSGNGRDYAYITGGGAPTAGGGAFGGACVHQMTKSFRPAPFRPGLPR